jgi:hypothetical protein
VPRQRLPEVERLAAEIAGAQRVGDPTRDGTSLGPVVSQVQYERVLGYMNQGIAEGARLVIGGTERPEGAGDGYFVAPTVFSDVRSDMTIAQEEIFGPVLALMPYDSEEEAIEIANGTRYGLSAGVWSGDPKRAQRVAMRLRSGQSRSMAQHSTRSPPSAATSNPASDANSACKVSRSTSRPRRSPSNDDRIDGHVARCSDRVVPVTS